MAGKKNSFKHPCSSHKNFSSFALSMCRHRTIACKCCRNGYRWRSHLNCGFFSTLLTWNSSAQAGAAFTVKGTVLWRLYIIQLWRSWATTSFLFSSLQQMNVVHHTVRLQIGSHHCCDVSTDWGKSWNGLRRIPGWCFNILTWEEWHEKARKGRKGGGAKVEFGTVCTPIMPFLSWATGLEQGNCSNVVILN